MKKYKVLHFVPGLNGGGIERFLERFISTAENLDIDYFDHIFLKHDINVGLIESDLLRRGHKVYSIIKKRESLFKYNFQFYRILKSVKPDIVHLHQNHAALYNVLFIKMFFRMPVIVHAHQFDNKKGFKERLRNIIVGHGLILADYRIACTSEASNWLFKGREDVILEYSMDMREFKYDEKDRDLLRREFNIVDRKVIGHIGRHSYQKNQFWLIDMFKSALRMDPSLFLLIVGEGELKEETIKYASELLPESSFKFCDVTNNISKFYSAFDLFVLPSRYEGLGIVAIESQISGLPTLITDDLPADLSITDNLHRYSLSDKEAWIGALLEMKSINRHQYFDIAKKSKFNTLDSNVKRWIGIYEKLV
jgi:glycosyltransferase involved in cell wall biosynthesis